MSESGTSTRRLRAVIVLPPLQLSLHYIDYPYFTNLAACQEAAVLQAAGLEVEILDGLSGREAGLVRTLHGFHLGDPEELFLDRLAGIDADLTVIIGSPFLLAAPARPWLKRLVATVRNSRPGWIILADAYVGGMHYLEVEPSALLADLPELDLYLRYECELLLAQLAELLIEGKALPRGVLENRTPFPLDDLPPPAWDLLDLEATFTFLQRVLSSPLRKAPLPASPARTLPVVTARGCSFGCVFCTRNPGLPEDRRQVRAVPFPRVEKWVRSWAGAFHIERLVVLDEVANLDSVRFGALLALVEELDLRLDFPNGLRADLLDERTVARLATRISVLKVSLESASPRVQRELLGKRLDPDAVRRVASWAHARSLPLEVHVMIGIPGETREEIAATLEMAQQLHDETGARPLLQFATPLPGTELERLCRERGLVCGPAADPHAGFQGRGVITTADFDPDFLEQCREAFSLALGPGKATIDVTCRCNNHCVFCSVVAKPAMDVSLPEIIGALERYREAGFEQLELAGGEPTLHPDLREIVAAARAIGFRRISLITNGRSLAYRTMALQLCQAGVDEVMVALHAPDAALQAELTSVPESFAQTTRGLRHILELLGPERVGVNTTVVAANLTALGDLGRLIVGLGVRRWTLQLARGADAGEELPARLRETLPELQIQVRDPALTTTAAP